MGRSTNLVEVTFSSKIAPTISKGNIRRGSKTSNLSYGILSKILETNVAFKKSE